MAFVITYNNIIKNGYRRFSQFNLEMINSSNQSSYLNYTVNIIIEIKTKAPKFVDLLHVLTVAVRFERYFIIHTVSRTHTPEHHALILLITYITLHPYLRIHSVMTCI